MAPDIIDLVSSSPGSLSAPSSRPRQAQPCNDAARGPGRGPERNPGQWRVRGSHPRKRLAPVDPGPTPTTADGLDRLDSLDCTRPSDDELHLPSAPLCARTKRRRTASPARHAAPAAAPRQCQAAARAPPLVPAPARRPLEPIDVSSSMEQDTSRPGRGGRAVAETTISSDPFASSPPMPCRPRHRDGPLLESRIPASSDPFASSPVPSRAVAKPRSSISQSPDARGLDDSISESPVPHPSPRPGRGTGPSLARAPTSPAHRDSEPHPRPTSTARGFARVLSESNVISIGDSDDPADASDSSGLADIADIGVATPRSRSPLRRSRSDSFVARPRPKNAATARRAVDRAVREAARMAEREQRKRAREQARAAKAREKDRAAALAEANKLRTDKKVSTPEMIVDMPPCLAPDLRLQIEAMLSGLAVEFASWDSRGQSVIKWRRKVTSRFDADLGRWEPIPLRVHDERHALVVLTADDFVGLATKGDMDSHVARVRDAFRHHHVLYLVQGMAPWMRKNRSLRNRQFAAGVRATAPQEPAAPGRRGRARARPAAADVVPEQVVDDALLRLQVEHGVLIHHTAVAAETARWVVALTQHLSTVPYRKQRDRATAAAGFCMESGQVRTGDDARDTYARMLQEIVRVTAPIAHGVAAEFDSVSKLVQGLEAGGPDRLQRVQRSANRNGQPSDRTIGPAVSRRIYKVFTGHDEGSTDV